MQLINKFNKEICFLLCVIDIFSKHACIIPLKNKKGSTITNGFQKTLKQSNRKPNKTWGDKGFELHNRSMKSQLEKDAIEKYSTNKEGKSVVGERKIYKHMT